MARGSRVHAAIPTSTSQPENIVPNAYPSKATYCIKYVLFFLNVLFWIMSCVIIAVATYAMLNKQELYGKVDEFTVTDPAVILVCVGVLMFLVSFSGCVGALRENICFLRFYSIMLGLMLLLEIAAAVLGYFYAAKVRLQAENAVDHMIKRYRDDPDLQNIIDFIQKELQCCGGKTYRDWEKNIYFNCSSPSVEKCGVPFSCCIEDKINSQCGFGVVAKPESEARKIIFPVGCVVALEKWLKTNLIMIASVAASLPLLQIVGFWCSMRLVNDIKDVQRSWT